ncbi:MAG: tyrosine-type recombinase/integrase [Chloroflexota bacterium]|jgi:site-specific recombinase XerD
MARNLTTDPSIASLDIRADAASFGRHLRATNLSPRTVQSYLEAVDLFTRYLDEQGMPTTLSAIRREHVESFIESLLARFKASTAVNRYAGLRAFFKWAVDEGEIKDSPMAKMRKPKQAEHLTPVLTTAQIEGILAACRGDGFTDRRDMAIIRLFLATGARLSEIAGLRWAPNDPTTHDVELDQGIIRIMGKGRRERVVHAGAKAVRALDRYERVRRQHPEATSTSYWLGRHGPMTPSGISQIIKDRGAQAGIPQLHAHMFRHWYAHAMLSAGHQEGDIMVLAGWRSREMLARYARATRTERALEASRRLNPADEL